MLLRAGLAIIALALAGGAYYAWRRPPRRLSRGPLDLPALGIEGPAIVQFTTPFCAPCKAARPVLEAAAGRSGIAYAQLDLTERPDAARRYGIRSAPTILVTAAGGEVFGVWTTVPREDEVVRAAAAAMRPRRPERTSPRSTSSPLRIPSRLVSERKRL